MIKTESFRNFHPADLLAKVRFKTSHPHTREKLTPAERETRLVDAIVDYLKSGDEKEFQISRERFGGNNSKSRIKTGKEA